MIQAKRLGHVVLNVRDAEKSRDFYTQTLGLKVAHENLERGAVFLSYGKGHHDLALFQQATGELPARTQPGLHHVAWRSLPKLRNTAPRSRFSWATFKP